MPLPPYFGQLDNTTTATADLKVLRCQGLRDFLVGCVRESLPVTDRNREGGGGLKKIFCSSRRFFLSLFFVLRLFLLPAHFADSAHAVVKNGPARGEINHGVRFLYYMPKHELGCCFSPSSLPPHPPTAAWSKCVPLSHTHGRWIRSHFLGRQIWGESPTDRLAEYGISPPLPSSKNGEIRGQFVFPGRVGRSKVPCCGSISFSEHGETRCFPTEEGSSSRFVIRLSQNTQNIYLPRQQPF